MSGSEKFVQSIILKFDGHYEFWSMTMKIFGMAGWTIFLTQTDTTYKSLENNF